MLHFMATMVGFYQQALLLGDNESESIPALRFQKDVEALLVGRNQKVAGLIAELNRVITGGQAVGIDETELSKAKELLDKIVKSGEAARRNILAATLNDYIDVDEDNNNLAELTGIKNKILHILKKLADSLTNTLIFIHVHDYGFQPGEVKVLREKFGTLKEGTFDITNADEFLTILGKYRHNPKIPANLAKKIFNPTYILLLVLGKVDREIKAEIQKYKDLNPDPSPSAKSKRNPSPKKRIYPREINFLENVVSKKTSEFLKGEELPDKSVLVSRLRWLELHVRNFLSGQYLPTRRSVMQEFAKAAEFTPRQTQRLLGCWAYDRMKHYETQYPIPENLSLAEKRILRAARWGFFRFYEGKISRVKRVKTQIMNRYLQQGKYSELMRESFFRVLGNLIDGKEESHQGQFYLRQNLGRLKIGDYWQPKVQDDLETINLDRIEEWFEALSFEIGYEIKELALEFIYKSGQLEAFHPVEIDKVNNDYHYGHIKIRKMGDGRFQIYEANGKGSHQIITKLREVVCKEDTPLKNEHLDIRPDGWLYLKNKRYKPFTLEDLEDLRPDDIKKRFEIVSLQRGYEINELAWYFKYEAFRSSLIGNRIVEIGSGVKDCHYGHIKIRRTSKGFEIYDFGLARSDTVLNKLRTCSITQGPNPQLTLSEDVIRRLDSVERADPAQSRANSRVRQNRLTAMRRMNGQKNLATRL